MIDNKRIIYILGVLLMFIGSSSFLYNYVNEKIDIAYEMMNEQLFSNTVTTEQKELKEELIESAPTEVVNEPEVVEQVNDNVVTEYYIGYLEIPKINLYRGFVDMNSEANNVQINLQIIKPSNYPDVEKGNFILAAHSGNGYNAYFKDLYKLSNDDNAYVYYNNKKYTYKITNIYTQPKVGRLSVYRKKDTTSLTLITCTKDDESTQTVYILDLISVE